MLRGVTCDMCFEACCGCDSAAIFEATPANVSPTTNLLPTTNMSPTTNLLPTTNVLPTVRASVSGDKEGGTRQVQRGVQGIQRAKFGVLHHQGHASQNPETKPQTPNPKPQTQTQTPKPRTQVLKPVKKRKIKREIKILQNLVRAPVSRVTCHVSRVTCNV